VGRVATEDIDIEVDGLAAIGRGMAHHSGGFTVVHVEWGGAPVRGHLVVVVAGTGFGRSVATVGNSSTSRRARTMAGRGGR
jgi:hypothetical protein